MPAQQTAEEVLYALLHGDTAVEAIVGKNIFPGLAHEGTEQRWITYSRISNLRVSSHDGFDDLSCYRYQINVWADDATVRGTLRDAVIDALDEYDNTVVGTTSCHIQHETDHDEMEPGPPKRFGAVIDFFVWI